MNADVEKAVEAVRTALNDWTATYASEFCDESAVSAARERISEKGTLGYIGGALASMDAIKQTLRDKDAEIARLRDLRMAYESLRQELTERAEKAEELLRDIKDWDVSRSLQSTREETLFAIPAELRKRITAHLGAKHD